jgi:hypothetical protein
LRELLSLSDRGLVQEIHGLEKYGAEDDAALKRFSEIRSDLSYVAWTSFSDALECDAGPISKTGMMSFPLDPALAGRFSKALLEGPKTKIRRDDFVLGYMRTGASMCDYLNEFMAIYGAKLEEILGHPFRIGSTRQFQLVPRTIAADKHVDGWPLAIRKLFILPHGAGRHLGTTWFQQRDNKEVTIESETPIWVIFENSVVLHAPVSAQALRPTIELDVLPARETGLSLFDAGLNGWYPWFPTDASLLAGTRLALKRCFAEEPAKDWKSLIRRLGRK